MTKTADIDWIKAERFYRAGVIPVPAIAEKCGVSRQAIYRKAKDHEWTRNLKAKIDATVTRRLVTKPKLHRQLSTNETVNKPGEAEEHTDAPHNVSAPVDIEEAHAREDEALIEAAARQHVI